MKPFMELFKTGNHKNGFMLQNGSFRRERANPPSLSYIYEESERRSCEALAHKENHTI